MTDKWYEGPIGLMVGFGLFLGILVMSFAWAHACGLPMEAPPTVEIHNTCDTDQ